MERKTVNLKISFPEEKRAEYEKLVKDYEFHKEQAALLKNKVDSFTEKNLKITQI